MARGFCGKNRRAALPVAAVGAGATTVQDVSVGLAESAAAEDEARTLAVADARRKAEVLARAAGVRLGAATLLAEELSGGGPAPIAFKMAAMEAAPTPVAAGSTDVQVDIQVTFAIAGSEG